MPEKLNISLARTYVVLLEKQQAIILLSPIQCLYEDIFSF